MTAFGAIRGLARAGLKVPEDLLGDRLRRRDACRAFGSVSDYGAKPMEALGSASVGIVLEAINATIEEREFEVVHRKLAPELVVRESSRSVPGPGGLKRHGCFSLTPRARWE